MYVLNSPENKSSLIQLTILFYLKFFTRTHLCSSFPIFRWWEEMVLLSPKCKSCRDSSHLNKFEERKIDTPAL